MKCVEVKRCKVDVVVLIKVVFYFKVNVMLSEVWDVFFVECGVRIEV